MPQRVPPNVPPTSNTISANVPAAASDIGTLGAAPMLTHPLTGCSKEDPTLGCSAAESALRRYLMHHPMLFDPKNPTGLMKQFGGTVRAQCLIHWMLHSDQVWFDGVLLPYDQAKYLYELISTNSSAQQQGTFTPPSAGEIFDTIERAQHTGQHAFIPKPDALPQDAAIEPAASNAKHSPTKRKKNASTGATDSAPLFASPTDQTQWYSSAFFIDFFSPIHWQDPLDILGEQTEEDFLNNNLAVRAFAHALNQQLCHLNLSEQHSEQIICQAVHQMYPKYAQQVHAMVGHLVHHAFYKYQAKVRSFGSISPHSPLMNVPTNLRPDFLALVLETIELVRSASGIGLEIGQKEQLDRSKKSVEKVYKALKKYYANSYPSFFDPLLDPQLKAQARAAHLHYPLSIKALELLDARFIDETSLQQHTPASRNDPPNG